MLRIALKYGIPKKDMILEEKANNTIGNAYYCNKIMVKLGFRSAIVVTSNFHIRRTRNIFKIDGENSKR